MVYFKAQHEEHLKLDRELLQDIESRISDYPKYESYLQGLLIVTDITQMVVALAKNSGLLVEHNASILKLAKQIKKKYSKILPSN